MSTTKLQEQIERATTRLAHLKAQEMIKAQREQARQRQTARQADANRKIKLGGLVIASDCGATEIDPAALVTVIQIAMHHYTQHPEKHDEYRSRGIAHLDARAVRREVR